METRSRIFRLLLGQNRQMRRRRLVGAVFLFIVSTILNILLYVYGIENVLDINMYSITVIAFGIVFAIESSYKSSGLLVSYTLVLAPILGALLVATYLSLQMAYPPAPMIGGFISGWDFWIPVALLLGTISFVIGFSLRALSNWARADA